MNSENRSVSDPFRWRKDHRMKIVRWLTLVAMSLAIGASLDASAGLLGIGGVSWKEEVLLHDGRKILTARSQTYGGLHEIGQSSPIKTQEIAFVVPGTNKQITFKSEYSDDVGRANFLLLALHILNDIPYIVAEPNLCLSYNKWGRPNPPYVIFKHDGKTWQRITLQELPIEFNDINLVVSTKTDEKIITAQSPVPMELIKKLNGSLRQIQYRSILREPISGGGQGLCPEMIFYKGGWVGPGDSIGKRMMDSRTK